MIGKRGFGVRDTISTPQFQSFTAVANQTTFTLTYAPSIAMVWREGLIQAPNVWSIVGNNIEFNTGVDADDSIRVYYITNAGNLMNLQIPLSTKGDLLGYSTDLIRIPVGTDGQVLKANSSTTSGLEWADESGSGGGATESGAAVYLSSSINASSNTIVPFNMERWDDNNYHDNSINNERITIPEDGRYQFNFYGDGQVNVGGISEITIEIILNSNEIIYTRNKVEDEFYSIGTYVSIGTDIIQRDLSAGDYLRVRINVSGGGTYNLGNGDSSRKATFQIRKLNGGGSSGSTSPWSIVTGGIRYNSNVGIGKDPIESLDIIGNIAVSGTVAGREMAKLLEWTPPHILAYSTTPTHNFNDGNDVSITLTGDITTFTLTNIPDGASGEIEVIQDATGGYGINAIAHAGLTIQYLPGVVPTSSNINSSANARVPISYKRLGTYLYVGFARFEPESLPRTAEIVTVTGTTYTLSNTDNGKWIRFTNSGATTVTVNSGLVVGFNCMLIQRGTGQVSVNAGSGVTISNRNSHTSIAGQNTTASLISDNTNEFLFQGDTA